MVHHEPATFGACEHIGGPHGEVRGPAVHDTGDVWSRHRATFSLYSCEKLLGYALGAAKASSRTFYRGHALEVPHGVGPVRGFSRTGSGTGACVKHVFMQFISN